MTLLCTCPFSVVFGVGDDIYSADVGLTLSADIPEVILDAAVLALSPSRWTFRRTFDGDMCVAATSVAMS